MNADRQPYAGYRIVRPLDSAARRYAACVSVLVVMLLAASVSNATTPAPPPCRGDCDGDGRVAIEELIRGVNIALGLAAVETCAGYAACAPPQCASIEYLVGAVAHALGGCAPIGAITPTPRCGDATLREAFSRCTHAVGESACVAAGGRWGAYPYSGRLGCFCPTGDGGCPCTARGDCVADYCFAPFRFECGEIREGSCSSVVPEGGCWCELVRPGLAVVLCIDP